MSFSPPWLCLGSFLQREKLRVLWEMKDMEICSTSCALQHPVKVPWYFVRIREAVEGFFALSCYSWSLISVFSCRSPEIERKKGSESCARLCVLTYWWYMQEALMFVKIIASIIFFLQVHLLGCAMLACDFREMIKYELPFKWSNEERSLNNMTDMKQKS